MQELKKLYIRISKQTQNKLQEIFDSFGVEFNKLYDIASKSTKNRVNSIIEEYKDKGLLTGYFGTLANNIYKRTRVRNSEILELLIYGAYIEEQSKLKEQELSILKENANYYYEKGQEEANQTLKKKKKTLGLSDALFLYLLSLPSSTGLTFDQYIDINLRYNAEQIYKKVVISIQQGKSLKIENIEFQNELKKQQTAKLSINEEKYSGSIDNFAIGINNSAKIEGIKSFDNDAKVRFIAVEDNVTTKMCQSLDEQIFNVNDWNEFTRYDGVDKIYKKYKCFGLVIGLNCPPINSTFHWCRSTIMYLPPVEKEEKTEYNGLASNTVDNVKEHANPKLLEKIDYNNIEEVKDTLKKYEKIIKNDVNENAIVITKDGEVYQCYGNNKNVWPDYDLQDKLQEAYMTHNHPKNETQHSFSEDDIALFNNYNLKVLRGIDYKYTYELTRNPKEIDEISIEDLMEEDNGVHALNINRASRINIGYRRWKNDRKRI
jgi:hypothetical protein